jgi:hypothetical protein
MSISHSDLMSIRSERSDAELTQCEIVIDIRQEFCCFSLSGSLDDASGCGFGALTEGARRATGVSAPKHSATGILFVIFYPSAILLLPHRLTLELESVRRVDQSVQDTVSHCRITDLCMPLGDRQLAG